MSYAAKEIYYTLQGEGIHAGRAAVFLRFTGCNLWSGREQDRPKGTGGCSRWCDTDFVGTNGPGGGRFRDATTLAEAVRTAWPQASGGRPLVVCTGGEPLLQLDQRAVDALHDAGFEVAVETNGTLLPPRGIDSLCVSPKAGSEIAVRAGHVLKLVFLRMTLCRSASRRSTSSTSYFSRSTMPNASETPSSRRSSVLSIRAGG